MNEYVDVEDHLARTSSRLMVEGKGNGNPRHGEIPIELGLDALRFKARRPTREGICRAGRQEERQRAR